MKHLIEISDDSETGKNLLNLLTQLSKRENFISFPKNGIDEIEDNELLKSMLESKNSGDASEDEILKTIINLVKQ